MMQGTSFEERVAGVREIIVYVCWGNRWMLELTGE